MHEISDQPPKINKMIRERTSAASMPSKQAERARALSIRQAGKSVNLAIIKNAASLGSIAASPGRCVHLSKAGKRAGGARSARMDGWRIDHPAAASFQGENLRGSCHDQTKLYLW